MACAKARHGLATHTHGHLVDAMTPIRNVAHLTAAQHAAIRERGSEEDAREVDDALDHPCLRLACWLAVVC